MGKQSREKWERREVAEVQKEIKKEEQTSLEKACLFIITWGTYLVLFTPLIINTKFFFPFVAPKTIFFRIIVEIILAAYLFLVISNSKYRPRINILTIAVVLFLGIFILSSFTGVNLGRSFWSTNERMTGIWTMLHLFAFFIVLSSTFKRRCDWEKILGVSIIVGVLLSLYILSGDKLSSRGGGTIGNTSFMAAYLLFDIFFAIILFLSKRGGWQIFSGISLLIMLPVLFTSSARGAIVAFCVGLFLLFLGYLIFSQKKALKRLALGIVLVLVIFGIISAIFQPPLVKNEVENTLGQMKSRFVVWEKGWQGFLERPILGWGPENFNNVFLKYFNSCMFLPECGSEIWFDRTHNIVFDTLVTTGIIGLFSYLAIFGIAIGGLLKVLPKVVERKNIFFPLGISVLLIVYFFQNLLVFDMINTYLLFFLSLGFISFLITKTAEEKEVKLGRVSPVLASTIVIITILTLWVGNIQPAIANRYLIKSLSSSYVEDASAYFQKSLRSGMEKYEPREQFAQKMVKSVNQEIPVEIREPLQKAFNLAEVEMEKSVKQNYLDFRPHLFLGQLYNSSYRLSGDTEKLEKAQDILQKAIQLSPTNQQGYWYLADTRLMQGRAGEAISLLQKAVDLEPRLGAAHWYLAMTYKVTGQYGLAKEEIIKMEGLDYNWQGNLTELEKVIEIYLALGDDAGLVPLYQKAITLNPTDAQLWASLVASYANLGQFEEAREAAQKVVEINPNLAPQIEEFLKNLP